MSEGVVPSFSTAIHRLTGGYPQPVCMPDMNHGWGDSLSAMQHSHPVRPSGLRWTAAVVWACLPLFTCGVATPLTIGIAAFWLRNFWHGVAASIYLVCIGIFVIAALAYDNYED